MSPKCIGRKDTHKKLSILTIRYGLILNSQMRFPAIWGMLKSQNFLARSAPSDAGAPLRLSPVAVPRPKYRTTFEYLPTGLI